MEQCPRCGHYTMSYDSAREEWVCFCQYTINTTTHEHSCPCKCVIHESKELYHERLHANNLQNRYSIDCPAEGRMN